MPALTPKSSPNRAGSAAGKSIPAEGRDGFLPLPLTAWGGLGAP